ncbi:HlyC/CorC family transporter [Alkalimarinus coralli]|uniref:HlyC/CorC family transporter n=1 Tax=Alkalimarinus coralli TaxID=2935863 RepID=UPI00202B84F2|nr:transporter associated domain-containing protein [Alkalimarinus coralli]
MSEDNSISGQDNKSWLEKISKAFSGEPQSTEDVTEILRTAEKQNVIDTDSLNIIEGAMQVIDMQVREVMIPRSQMITVKASQEPEEYLDDIISSAHSRFPVIGESPDDVVGILLAKDLLPLALKGELRKNSLTDVLRPATVVPESKRLNQLLKEFKATRNHMAIVVDEYGGISGLVTIEDVLEQIVGEIEDEHDIDEEALIKVRGAGEYIIKAITPIEDFNEFFKLELSEDNFDTIGGLVLQQFGRLPRRGESVEFSGFRFTVLNADNRTVRLLQAHKTR